MQHHNFLLLGVIVSLVALTGCVHGAVLAKDNNSSYSKRIDFGTAVINYFNAVKKAMPCGYPAMNLPVFAPFTKEFLPLNFSNQYLSVQGNISNIELTGLNKFRFIAFDYDEETNVTSYDLIFPELQLLAEYMHDIWALLAGFPVSAAGQGLLNMKLIDLRLVGHFTLASSELNSNGLAVSDFELRYYVGNVLTNNWNDFLDISANNFVNRWISEYMLMWSQQLQIEVMDEVYDKLWLPKINEVLRNVTMNQLINSFVDASKEINTLIKCTLT